MPNMTMGSIECSRGKTNFSFDGTESGLWDYVGQTLQFVPEQDFITITVGSEQAQLQKLENYIKLMFNNIKSVSPSEYHKKDLRRVDAEKNAYQFYRIVPLNMGGRTVSCSGSYGRIGAGKKDLSAEQFIKPYPSCMYWVRYYEKLNKGYSDMSDEIVDEEEDRLFTLHGMATSGQDCDQITARKASVPTTPAAILYDKLIDSSRQTLTEQFDVTFLSGRSPFTNKQVESSWEIWKSLGKSKDVNSFNAKIKKLLAICPRKIDPYHGMTVKSYYAKEVDDPTEQAEIYKKIIDREESLILAMEAVTSPISGESLSANNFFKGIDVKDATDDEFKEVLDLISSTKDSDYLKPMLKHVWRVEPKAQRGMFESYLLRHKIQNTKLLFHGSKTENWLSIIKYSLMLNPNAQITGKMFGMGIYFAPSADKSYGYTSGGRWNNNAATPSKYMGVYETAYGKPYHPNSSGDYSQNFLNEKKCDCIHARSKDTGLRRDEIIYYDESAICMKYLCEFQDN